MSVLTIGLNPCRTTWYSPATISKMPTRKLQAHALSETQQIQVALDHVRDEGLDAPNRLFLLDGSGVITKMQTVPWKRRLSSHAGEDTTVLLGFLRHFLSLLKTQLTPTHVIVALDGQGKTAKHHLYPEYKQGRYKAAPEEDTSKIQQMLGPMGIKWVMVDGVAADDAIGTLSHRFASDDVCAYIFSRDKDFFQVLSDRVVFIKGPGRDKRYTPYTPSRFQEEFGIASDRWIEMMALNGDVVDNIPGLPRIGNCLGTMLIRDYGNVEEVFAHKEEVTLNSVRTSLSSPGALENAQLSRSLLRIDCKLQSDVLKFELDEAKLQPLPNGGASLEERMDHYDIRKLKDEYLQFFDTIKEKKEGLETPLEQNVR